MSGEGQEDKGVRKILQAERPEMNHYDSLCFDKDFSGNPYE